MKVIEAMTTKQALDVVTGRLETDAGISKICALLETSDSLPCVDSHVHHIQIQYAHLHIATGSQDTFTF